jgi:hypothetical protein
LGEAKQQRPMSVKELAFEVDPSQWLSVEWREGTNFTLFGFAVEGIAGARAA